MRARLWALGLLCLLCGVGAWFVWHHGNLSAVQTRNIVPTTVTARSLSTAPLILAGKSSLTNAVKAGTAGININKFAYRLSNTTRSIGQLVNDNHAILLENALIDTANPLNFSIPANLRATGDPGAYIVQARGPIGNAFRAMLAQAGATIVSYIPNDAYLVRASASVASLLGANPQTQTVIPYEPYYKVQSSLLAYDQGSLPKGAALNLGLFADDASATIQQIEKLGGQIFAQDRSPFGPIVRVQLPPALAANWTALAGLTGVQIIEPYFKRAAANDLARVTLGVSTDTVTPTNYLNLTGSNIIVEVNDTGIDAQHPDFTLNGTAQSGPSGPTRVFGDAPQSLVDTDGHGTHVAGIIAGNGAESSTFSATNLPAGSVTNADFRGKAPQAILYSVGGIQGGADTNVISDLYFQEVPALTNALISNNSWDFPGDNQYDLSAASYDAAVRDALPFVTGSQPVLFVFAAGNSGAGGDNGSGGNGDTILSPATGKDVITVGATEQLRKITNWVTALDGSSNQIWLPQTDSSSQVAGYSSRGNVGIGIEGIFGRYKPDVVAPGTFVVSTRSEQWDTNAYYNPTNFNLTGFSDAVDPGIKNFYSLVIPRNIVGLNIQLDPNIASPNPFPTNLPILVWDGTSPRTTAPYVTGAGSVTLPPPPITPVNSTWQYAVSNNTSITVNYDVLVDIITTNDNGNLFQVLDQLNESLGSSPHYYRYETGTSMATPSVSGVLALMQEFYANAYGVRPSPAMLKAMLINGARATDNDDFNVDNSINFQGWGLVNLPAALQPGITNQPDVACSIFIQDQNPTNALATGDSQTFYVSITNTQAQQQPLRVTLAWTDPPGDPAAAIKLVNNLVLVVTNFDNPTNSVIYYGNDIGPGNTFNNARGTNDLPVFDFINNVQNVYITAPVGTNYSITVLGHRVNVNAVTAQTNNVVQDFALVISSGDGAVTNAMTVTTLPPSTVSNPTGDQQITYLSATNNNGILLNQFVGANTPLLGNNTVPLGTITVLDTNGLPIPTPGFTTNAVVTVGMTNQWHFYVVTNTFAATNSAFTNAAFVTFIPETLSIPRMGVFAGTTANATRSEADIDLYVSTDPTLTNLNPAVISNCVHGTQVGLTAAGPKFAGASLSRLGTEFVADIGSQANEVYYIGVKSEDQMAAEYAFLSVFSATPFSQMNPNGTETVFGLPVPSNIPDGSPALPGIAYVIGIALQPMELDRVTVTNQVWHQNFGDLIGTFTHDTTTSVLNNHDSVGNTFFNPPFAYDDTPYSGVPSDGPGSLNSFIGQQGIGAWILSEEDNSLTQTGLINNAIFTLQPHRDLTKGITVVVPPGGWFYGFVDVPPGATNLTLFASNVTVPPDLLNPLQMFEKFSTFPTLTNFDAMVGLTNGTPPSGTISIGPPLVSGRYFVGIFNPGPTSQSVFILATIGLPFVPAQTIYNSADTPIPILDDAVTTDSIFVPDNAIISAMDVAIAVAHPRISDLVFHLISPDGTRVLLMENRGGTDPNGAGGIATITTNTPLASTFEGQTATNYTAGQIVGGWTVAGNQVSVVTDPTNAYQGTNLLALANGALSTTLATVPGQTYTLTFAYRGPGIAGWWRGESNTVAVDSAYGNNGALIGGVSYTNGYVNQALRLDGTSGYVSVPSSPNLNIGTGSGVTIEGWINPFTPQNLIQMPVVEWDTAGTSGLQWWLSNPNTLLGNLFANIVDTTGNSHLFITGPGLISFNTFQHVALTYDKNSGAAFFYRNGIPVASTNFGNITPQTGPAYNLYFGKRTFSVNEHYGGLLDELSIYNRALSASEIQAISADGTAGKFDRNEFPLSARQSLAEAQISLNGVTTNIFGDNTIWQTYMVSFKATQTSTPLQIQGIEPGMLLDAASVVSAQTNYNYLVFTENTNLTTTPIKFAVPPFEPGPSTNIVAASGFDLATPNDYISPTTFTDGTNVWGVLGNQVSVVNDSANADSGSHFLALANGSVSNILPTVAGHTYVLTFRYRGPGIVGWWRGENNTNDSSGFGNNAVSAPNITYAGGEVGQAFGFSGLSSITIPASASLAVSNLTFEGWIYPTTTTYEPIVDYGGPGQGSAAHMWINGAGLSSIPGVIYGNMRPNANVAIQSAPGTVPVNAWSHIAFTYNLSTATEHLYYNGGSVAVNVATPDIPPSAGEPVNLGWRNNAEALSGRHYTGLLDEISIYNRALSASKIKAIYNDGHAGKFDPGAINPQSLAEAQVSLNGGTPATFLGDNNNWQTRTIIFTATQNGTPLQITGVEPGMLLDSFSLSESTGDIYYLPEQSLDTFDGLNALGTWTLEVQDDRVGATNPTPLLLNWQLRFNYVTTGTNAAGIPPGTTVTNVIPAGDWDCIPVNVPTNADFATNILVFATAPLDMWFNPTNCPVGTNPPDWELLAASTGGSATLSLTSSPTNIVPGTTYFIGLHNTNVFGVTNGFRVDFHLILPPTPLTNGVPITNTIPASIRLTGHGFGYYSVTVPTNADYATNRLLFATAPVNLWFNQTNVPVGTNPPDYLLITNATNGISILSPGTTPPLRPGLTYDLAIQNTNGAPVTIGLVVDFHFVSTNIITGPAITQTNINGTNGFLLRWSGPTNNQYTIQWKTNLAPVFPWNTVPNPVINVTYTPTNGDYSWFDDGSLTGGWPPAKFYRILANFIAAPITNSAPTTNVVVSGTITPLTVTVPAGVVAATNLLLFASGPVDVWFNQVTQPTGNTNAGDVLMLSNVTSGAFVLTGSSVPPLVPGANYYLGVQSLGTSNVVFSFQVNFAYASTNPPSISSITVTNINGTNAVLLKWVAPTNYQFQVEWATNLTPAIAWHTIPNVVLTWSGVLSPTNAAYGIFQYLDDGSQTGGWGPLKFYRLVEYPYATPIPQTLTIINTAIVGSAVRFQWVAPTNYQYAVLWTTNLGLPLASWSVLANPVLGLSNGVYTFTDTNQTGPATAPKFFRLLEH